jgi:hypothetical protein
VKNIGVSDAAACAAPDDGVARVGEGISTMFLGVVLGA